MKKYLAKKYVIISIISIFFLMSCENEETQNIPSGTEHTLFMYMPWSSNLTSDFEKNILDVKEGISHNILENDRVLVFFQTTESKATLFELKYEKGKCVSETLKYYDNPAVTTVDGITSILLDVIHYSPTKRYSMTINGHGMGWLPVSHVKTTYSSEKEYWEYEDAPLTRYFGGLTTDYQTDIITLALAIKNTGIKMDYILFDNCYMSNIEVAYDLRNVTNYIIASPTEIMAYGMPYANIIKHMVGHINYDGICRGFLDFYQNYKLMPCGTIGIIDCRQIEKLAQIMKKINRDYEFDPSFLNNIQRMDGYNPVRFFDFGDYVRTLCTDKELLIYFEEQLELTVPSKYRMHTEYYYSMNMGEVEINTYTGCTISDPSESPYIWGYKTDTEWYIATH